MTNLYDDMKLEVIATDLGFTEGPVTVRSGELFVCSCTHGAVYRLNEGMPPHKFDTGGGANGMTSDASGTLYVAQNGGNPGIGPSEAGLQRIVGDEVQFILTGLSAPNDICFGPDGRIYFTDPGRDGKPYEPEAGVPGRLYSCAADGSDLRLLHEGLKFINGLAFDITGERLYLAETAKRRILAADWSPDGSIGEPAEVSRLPEGAPDGFAFDSGGNLWVAAGRADCLLVLSAGGSWIGRVSAPEGSLTTNCCFAGDDMRTLIVTAGRGGLVLRGRTETPGHPLHSG